MRIVKGFLVHFRAQSHEIWILFVCFTVYPSPKVSTYLVDTSVLVGKSNFNLKSVFFSMSKVELAA